MSEVGTTPPPILGLLADPLRWQLVQELARSDRRVGELMELVGKPQSLVSYHLAELRRGGVVRARRSSADGRDVYYRGDLAGCRDLLGQAGQALHPGLAPGPARHRRGRRPRLLFLCTGNSARSQMAEALAAQRSEGAVEARSAGSHPKALHPDAVRVMAERGIDIAGRPTKPLTRFTGHRFDRVITLCDKVREICPEPPRWGARAHWSIADPAAGGGHAAFVATADDLEERVGRLLADLQIPAPERTHHG